MHAHEREIVADWQHPLKKQFKVVSRAVRLVKKLSDEHTWTLWNMSCIKLVLEQKVRLLKPPPDQKYCDGLTVCKCGNTRKNKLTMLKVDASQFFKNADIDRGLARIEQMLPLRYKSNLCTGILG